MDSDTVSLSNARITTFLNGITSDGTPHKPGDGSYITAGSAANLVPNYAASDTAQNRTQTGPFPLCLGLKHLDVADPAVFNIVRVLLVLRWILVLSRVLRRILGRVLTRVLALGRVLRWVLALRRILGRILAVWAHRN